MYRSTNEDDDGEGIVEETDIAGIHGWATVANAVTGDNYPSRVEDMYVPSHSNMRY